jgi:UDP-N-acetylmuramyl pentapeptide phosphotransferase/UDP-N-acetylglucosamine-1-phosphate transferase
MFFSITAYLIIIYFINNFFSKKKILESNTGSKHQSFANNSVPLSGGILIFFPVLNLLIYEQPLIGIIFFLLFFLGIYSDLNILSSPKKRFLIQIIIILIFVFFSKLSVLPTRIEFIDNIFSYPILNYLFTAFCLMVLINGSNFIDGLNGILIGYFLIVMFFIYNLSLLDFSDLSNFKELFILITVLFLIVMNFFNKLFLGDNGAYSLSFLMGVLLINIYNLNQNISPYFIILLLWYPCFENLFSIIRKFIEKKNPLKPDNNHLHQLIYLLIKKKYKLNNLKSNNISSLIIITYNFAILYAASWNIYYTKHQLMVLSISIFLYLIIFFNLRNILK